MTSGARPVRCCDVAVHEYWAEAAHAKSLTESARNLHVSVPADDAVPGSEGDAMVMVVSASDNNGHPLIAPTRQDFPRILQVSCSAYQPAGRHFEGHIESAKRIVEL